MTFTDIHEALREALAEAGPDGMPVADAFALVGGMALLDPEAPFNFTIIDGQMYASEEPSIGFMDYVDPESQKQTEAMVERECHGKSANEILTWRDEQVAYGLGDAAADDRPLSELLAYAATVRTIWLKYEAALAAEK